MITIERWLKAKEGTAQYTLKELDRWLNTIIHWHGASRGYVAQKAGGKLYLSVLMPKYSQLKFRWSGAYGCMDVNIETKDIGDTSSWILPYFATRTNEFRVFGQGDDLYTAQEKSWAAELVQTINERIKATLIDIVQENDLCICGRCECFCICKLIQRQWLCETCSKKIHPIDETNKSGGSIYFISTALSDDIKIGWTRGDVERRMATFCLPESQILAIEKGDRLRESELHRKFHHCRIGNSEWFKAVPELMTYIASCNQRGGA